MSKPASISAAGPGRPRFITVEAAAEALGVSSKTVRRWTADGTLTGYRVGPRFLRVAEAEVYALARPIGGAA